MTVLMKILVSLFILILICYCIHIYGLLLIKKAEFVFNSYFYSRFAFQIEYIKGWKVKTHYQQTYALLNKFINSFTKIKV
jgi:hypothetical protein